MKIGVFGGTFDPIHIGHLMSAELAREQLNLDKILFIPAKIPPHKQDKQITDASHRLRMIELSIADNPYFEVSDLEIQSNEAVSYTWHTIKKIKELYNDVDIYFLLGADTFYDLPNWTKLDYILNECTLVGFNRLGENSIIKDNNIIGNNNIILINAPRLEISSTDIRYRLTQYKSVRYMINDQVLDYIKENCLYAKVGELD